MFDIHISAVVLAAVIVVVVVVCIWLRVFLRFSEMSRKILPRENMKYCFWKLETLYQLFMKSIKLSKIFFSALSWLDVVPIPSGAILS